MQNLAQQFVLDYFYSQFPPETILPMSTQPEKRNLVKKFYSSFSDNEIITVFYYADNEDIFFIHTKFGNLKAVFKEGVLQIYEGKTLVKAALLSEINSH